MVRYSKKLQKLVAADRRLAEYFFEHPGDGCRRDDNVTVHWIRIGTGWCVESEGLHLAGAATVAEVAEQLRYIKPCHCADCAQGVGFSRLVG